MFKSLDDIKQYVEENCTIITAEPERCYICGKYLADTEGWTEYYLCDEYAPDEKFCSEECIIEFLQNKIGIQEEDE